MFLWVGSGSIARSRIPALHARADCGFDLRRARTLLLHDCAESRRVWALTAKLIASPPATIRCQENLASGIVIYMAMTVIRLRLA